ncbi:MAG: ABC transporter permease [Bryobacteraceae bacterium]
MRFLWAIAVALRAARSVLAQNRWRSLATLAVCGAGTAGVFIAGVLAEIQVAEMQARLSALGSNLFVISPNKLPPFPGRPRQLEHFISLLPGDAAALGELVPSAKVVPVAARETTIRLDRQAARVRLIGTTPDYLRVRNFSLQSGRFLSAADDGERVIVLGYAVSRVLRPQGIRPGETLFLGGDPYTVIGALDPQGVNFAGEDEDQQAFIPLATYQRRIANRLWLSHLYVQLPPRAGPEPVADALRQMLRERHGRWEDQVDDTVIRNLSDLAVEQSELLSTVVWVVSITGLLLLLMGVAGIVTLLLLVVRQRRAEIGLRRALGATPADIAIQFFVEGIVFAGSGIHLGLGLGWGGSFLVTKIFAMQVAAGATLPLLGILVSMAACTVACVIPAIVAARLEPSDALRA